MAEYYLAVDIGASSGRHLLGHLERGRLVTQEIHRFENGLKRVEGHLCWDLPYLFEQILEGMKKCAQQKKVPVSMGVDTWGVDFVLLDGQNRILGQAVGYRDGRTRGMDEAVSRILSEEALYGRTGIQKQLFNTIYQLEAVKESDPQSLERAARMLLLPDYFHFLLTGEQKTEYTIATTTQLVSPATKDWDWELIGKLGFPERLFAPIQRPGTPLGRLREEVQRQVGFDCAVVLPCAHDTASAVLAVPTDRENALYISSGTWSLLGTEREEADCGQESRAANFTNEGGYDYRYRYLKNIMGLWMIQSLRREWGNEVSFEALCDMAQRERIDALVDCQDQRFLAPVSMERAIREFCEESGQQVPKTRGQFARVVYRSLAACYATAVRRLEAHTGLVYPCIYVVGGGSQADYLNRLTAEATGKAVCAGPAEATGIGNLAAQMIQSGALQDLWDARRCIFASSAIKLYHGKDGKTGDDEGKI